MNSNHIYIYITLDYPEVIAEWLRVLNSTYYDPSVPPPAVNSLNNVTIQLGPSTDQSYDILYDLNTWSDYSVPLERQYTITKCKVLED
jgi:hypothetical protein